MKGQIKIGTYTGTGAAIVLELGFAPDYFKSTNITDGDILHEWYLGMAADTTVDTAAAVVTNAADGVTAYAGTGGLTSVGLTLGTDLSESAKVYYYIAVANA